MEASVSSSLDDDFGPQERGRCYTWPMQQFVTQQQQQPQQPGTPVESEPTVAQLLAATPCSSNMGQHLMPLGLGVPGAAQQPAKKKRCRKKPADQLAQKKPNPWGEESYSDLIAKALEAAPDGRLKLNEIYQWFSDNIGYFRERSSQEEAAGWKNSIRHNLSLHSRFMRIQNEGAGKSSWWVINPDAKPGRNPRRQRASTLDSTNKAAIEKKRRGARKKVMEMRGIPTLNSTGSSVLGSQVSIAESMYDDDSMGMFDFRQRAQSNMSVPGSSARVSPSMEPHTFDDFDFPPWVDAANHVPIPSDILDRTGEMRLDGSMDPNSAAYRQRLMNGGGGPPRDIKPDLKPIKQEPSAHVPPPSYHELNSVRGPHQLQNPLLRGQLKMPAPGLPYFPQYSSWMSGPSCASQQSAGAAQTSLPIDLENLTLPDAPLMEMDMEALLRHELSQTSNNQLNFDI